MISRWRSSTETNGRSPHLNEDQCINFLYDLLPDEDKERMLEHLKDCPMCEQLFMGRVAERENLRASKALRRQPNGTFIIEDTDPADKRERVGDQSIIWNRFSQLWKGFQSKFRHHRVRWVLGSVVVVVLLLLMIIQPGGKPDVEFYWLDPVGDDIQNHRSMVTSDPSDTNPDEDLMRGFQAYADKDLHIAIELLQAAEVSEDFEPFRRIFLGSSYALCRRYHEAVAVLQVAELDDLPRPWRSEAQWTLYGALLKTGQMAVADSILTILARESGKVGQRARSRREQIGRD